MYAFGAGGQLGRSILPAVGREAPVARGGKFHQNGFAFVSVERHPHNGVAGVLARVAEIDGNAGK